MAAEQRRGNILNEKRDVPSSSEASREALPASDVTASDDHSWISCQPAAAAVEASDG